MDLGSRVARFFFVETRAKDLPLSAIQLIKKEFIRK
jgi:hypothetical protein